MTERRLHWDDDLIDAVRDAVDVEFDGIWRLSEDSIRAVIAAVEDWELGFHAQTEGVTHSAECWRWHHECARTLIEQQQAAIQAVREMCDTIVQNSHRFQDAWDEDPTAAQVPYGQAMVARHILQALDGERDD